MSIYMVEQSFLATVFYNFVPPRCEAPIGIALAEDSEWTKLKKCGGGLGNECKMLSGKDNQKNSMGVSFWSCQPYMQWYCFFRLVLNNGNLAPLAL